MKSSLSNILVMTVLLTLLAPAAHAQYSLMELNDGAAIFGGPSLSSAAWIVDLAEQQHGCSVGDEAVETLRGRVGELAAAAGTARIAAMEALAKAELARALAEQSLDDASFRDAAVAAANEYETARTHAEAAESDAANALISLQTREMECERSQLHWDAAGLDETLYATPVVHGDVRDAWLDDVKERLCLHVLQGNAGDGCHDFVDRYKSSDERFGELADVSALAAYRWLQRRQRRRAEAAFAIMSYIERGALPDLSESFCRQQTRGRERQDCQARFRSLAQRSHPVGVVAAPPAAPAADSASPQEQEALSSFDDDVDQPLDVRQMRAENRITALPEGAEINERRRDCRLLGRANRRALEQRLGQNACNWWSSFRHPYHVASDGAYTPEFGILGNGFVRVINGQEQRGTVDASGVPDSLSSNDSTISETFSSSFGLGVEYRSWAATGSAFVNFGTQPATLGGSATEFGRFILSPETANIAFTSALYLYPFSFGSASIQNQLGSYMRFGAGTATWRSEESQDIPARSINAVGLSLASGVEYRVMSRNRIGFGIFAGWTMRSLLGDVAHNRRYDPTGLNDNCISVSPGSCPLGSHKEFRRALIGTVRRGWQGGELGTRVYIDDLTVSVAVTPLHSHGDPNVSGLTGGQMLASVEFRGGFRTDATPAPEQLSAAIQGERATVVGAPVTANVTVVNAAGGGVSGYEWDCNRDDQNNAVLESAQASCSYDAPGTYTIRVTVTDNEDRSAMDEIQVVVSAPAEAGALQEADPLTVRLEAARRDLQKQEIQLLDRAPGLTPLQTTPPN